MQYCCVEQHKKQQSDMYTPLDETVAKPLENPDHQVTLLGERFPYFKNGIILKVYFSIISDHNHFQCTNCQQVPPCILHRLTDNLQLPFANPKCFTCGGYNIIQAANSTISCIHYATLMLPNKGETAVCGSSILCLLIVREMIIVCILTSVCLIWINLKLTLLGWLNPVITIVTI